MAEGQTRQKRVHLEAQVNCVFWAGTIDPETESLEDVGHLFDVMYSCPNGKGGSYTDTNSNRPPWCSTTDFAKSFWDNDGKI